MKTKSVLSLLVLVASAALLLTAPASAGPQLGVGIHYLKTVGDLKDAEGFDDSAIGYMGSISFSGPLIRFEGDLEYIPDYGGTDEAMFVPQGWALLGDFIYGGVGVGVAHFGDFGWQDPFYALRAGVNLGLGGLGLDVFGTYRFQKSSDLEGLGSDDLNAVTFGALVRFGG